MTEEAELQAKIAAIAGRINQHKQHQSGALYPPSGQRYQYAAPPSRSYTHRSPYARGGRVPHTQIHRNRTLVLGGTQTPPSSTSGTATPSTPPVPNSAAPTESFVSTRGAGTNSLMKKDTFDREQKQRLERKDQRRAAKRQKLNRDEKIKLMQHVRTASTSGSREMIVEGLRFQLRDDGSKLIRISGEHNVLRGKAPFGLSLSASDPSASNRDTPKQVQIAGVDFVRTRNGNLVRANAVRDLGRYFHTVSEHMKGQDSLCHCHRSNPFKGPCANFTKNGTYTSLPTMSYLWTGSLDEACMTPNSPVFQWTVGKHPLLSTNVYDRYLSLWLKLQIHPRPRQGCRMQNLPSHWRLSSRRALRPLP